VKTVENPEMLVSHNVEQRRECAIGRVELGEQLVVEERFRD
jgi:hypothetical protein